MMTSLRLFGVQVANKDALSTEDIAYNIEHSSNLITKHFNENKLSGTPCMYVLPETSSVGYADDTFSNAAILAEKCEPGAQSYDGYSRLAQSLGIFVCYGFIHRKTEDKFCVSQAVMNSEGKLAALYDKIHLCNFGDCKETDFFTHGSVDQSNHVFDCFGFKCGLAICFDLRFPESFRTLALNHGCDVIVHSSCFPKDGKSADWHSFVITRALENQVYVLTTNRAGSNFGRSIACPPWLNNELVSTSLLDDEEFISITVDRTTLAEIRKSIPLRQSIQFKST